MAAFKRDGKWYIKGRIKKENNEYYQYTKLAKGCKYVNEAREYENEFVKQWQNIKVAEYSKTFKELADEYIKQATNIKAVTKRTDEDIIDKCNKVFGNKKINLFNKDYLQKYINNLEEKFSKSYVSKYYYTISKIFKYAVNEEYLTINPMSKVKRALKKDEVKKEMLFWETDEFEIFLDHIENEEMKRMFILLYYTGMRKGELQALQWKDIDFKSNSINVYKTVTNKIKGKAWEITSPKTKNSVRNISMPEVVKSALEEQKKYCSVMYGFNDDCFVFGFSRPLPSETIRQNLNRAVKSANDNGHDLKRIRVHDFRHSHVSYLVNNKSDKFTDYDIAQRIGDTVQTIQSTYAHMFKDSGKKIIDFINEDTSKAEKTIEQPKRGNYGDLIELKQLLDMDIITDNEFALKKKEILGL